MAKIKRRLFPLEVTIAPNHDRFNRAFWVDIISCEPLELVKRDQRPFLRVKADPEKNQIIVTARSVSEIGLYLNDYLLDLDKEVSIVVNGKVIKGEKFQAYRDPQDLRVHEERLRPDRAVHRVPPLRDPEGREEGRRAARDR